MFEGREPADRATPQWSPSRVALAYPSSLPATALEFTAPVGGMAKWDSIPPICFARRFPAYVAFGLYCARREHWTSRA